MEERVTMLGTLTPARPGDLPVYSGCYGHYEGTLCIWQVGGGNNPVVPRRKEAEAAYFLGIAMWYTA